MLITNFQLIWILLFQFQETLIFDDEFIQLGLILLLIILDVALISIFIRKMIPFLFQKYYLDPETNKFFLMRMLIFICQNLSVEKLFSKAKAYASSINIIDLKMESMKGLFDGTKNLYIHANSASDIRDAIDFSEKHLVRNIIIVGGEDALAIATILVEKNIPVILNRVHRLPKSQDSPVDEPFKQAKELQDAGVLFCLSYEGDMEAMGARNLSFTAGTTIAYGQEYEKAVQSITLNTAKILGIADIVGSIESGKKATFFISSGDALDMRTNNVEQAFINGIAIDLNNHQKELFEKYRNR